MKQTFLAQSIRSGVTALTVALSIRYLNIPFWLIVSFGLTVSVALQAAFTSLLRDQK